MTVAFPSLRSATDGIGEWWRAQWAVRRARIAVVALAFALGVSGLFWLDARGREIRQDLAQTRLLISRTEKIGPTDLWRQRRAETDGLRRQTEGRFWEGETDGLAQANFQSWIADQANQAGLRITDIRSSINTTTGSAAKLRHISAQISGRFDPDAFFKLLQVVATHQRTVVVEQLEIQIAPVPRFDMTLGGFLPPRKA
jgi:hypothetical protein